MSFDLAQLAGPLGGVIAAAFGAGATAGYGFCLKTMFKVSQAEASELRQEMARRDAQCDRRVDGLEARVRELEDRSFKGMARQLAQVRESAKHVILGGEE